MKQVKVPPGVEDGNKLRVKNEGDAGAKGGPVGDLYVFLGVKSHPTFKRSGKDIYSDRKVGFTAWGCFVCIAPAAV